MPSNYKIYCIIFNIERKRERERERERGREREKERERKRKYIIQYTR